MWLIKLSSKLFTSQGYTLQHYLAALFGDRKRKHYTAQSL